MLIFIFVLCVVMGLTLVGFSLYQLYLIQQGTTANESSKWADVKDFYHSKKWKEHLAKQGADQAPDEMLIGPDAPTLAGRLVKEFPSKMPRNIYQKSFFAALKDVFYPESLPARRKLLASAKANGSQPLSKTIPTGASVNGKPAAATTAKDSNNSKDTGSGAKKKKGGKKKD